MSQPILTPADHARYSRHLLLPEIGETGQRKLKDASVLIVGMGGLGCPAALYLAAAGVGRIGIVDPDDVDRSNLQRQVLFGESSLGKPKVLAAAARLADLNPLVRVEPHTVRLTPENAMTLAAGYDLILDGCDNFPTRFLTCDTAFFLKKPLIHGAIQRFEGQLTVFTPHLGGPCYRCLVPTSPPAGAVPSCAEAGVLGVLPGVIGTLQAAEAAKLLLGIGGTPDGVMICYDALSSSFRRIRLKKDPRCALCGEHPSITSVSNPETAAAQTCETGGLPEISAEALRDLLSAGGDVLILDVREPAEHASRAIPCSRLIPLASLADHLEELPRDRDIVVHCQSGGRSARATGLLLGKGFSRVRNLTGGIRAWQLANG